MRIPRNLKALLASFLWEHSGHSCTVFNEHCPEEETLGPFETGMREDTDFWRDPPVPPTDQGTTP